jgi:hypothetical protein
MRVAGQYVKVAIGVLYRFIPFNGPVQLGCADNETMKLNNRD